MSVQWSFQFFFLARIYWLFKFFENFSNIRIELVETSRTSGHMPGFNLVDDDVIDDFVDSTKFEKRS